MQRERKQQRTQGPAQQLPCSCLGPARPPACCPAAPALPGGLSDSDKGIARSARCMRKGRDSDNAIRSRCWPCAQSSAALGRVSPWHMKLRCLDLVAAFLLGASSAVCTRQPPAASVLARFCLPAWSAVRAWLLRLRTVFDFAPEHLPAPDPVLRMSAPVRRGAVANARLGLA